MRSGCAGADLLRGALAVGLIFVIALQASARVRAVHHPERPPRSVLWIAAHPDDEAVAAPLLERWCMDEGARCGLLILTRGEAGPCLLPGGCVPDVATVRSAEAGAAAQLFGAELIHLSYPDGGVALSDETVSTIARYVEAFRPELILTFDPRHGTTCHSDHRETGRIVIEAMSRLSFAPKLFLLETRLHITPEPFSIAFTPATPAAQRFNAAPNWSAIVRDMQRHPSQFDAQWIAAIEQVPLQDRAVYLAPASVALQQPVSGCP